MKVSIEKLTVRELRIRLAAAGILTIHELASRVACSRTAIYLAIKNPGRCPRVSQKIRTVITTRKKIVCSKTNKFSCD
jgi:hypothetical protein